MRKIIKNEQGEILSEFRIQLGRHCEPFTLYATDIHMIRVICYSYDQRLVKVRDTLSFDKTNPIIIEDMDYSFTKIN